MKVTYVTMFIQGMQFIKMQDTPHIQENNSTLK